MVRDRQAAGAGGGVMEISRDSRCHQKSGEEVTRNASLEEKCLPKGLTGE